MYISKPELFTLQNGLRVIYMHAPAQVAHFGVNVLAGSRFEKENEEGLAHFLEHCIFKGTKKRKTYHVLSRLDSVGGELNAYTSKEEMCVYASFTKNHTKRAIDLLADITLNSNFPVKEIEKEKEIILDEINSYLDNPSEKIFDDFESYLFEGHSLGTNILGTKESVNSFTKKNLEEYMSRHFHVDNMVLSFVGDFPLQKLKKLLELSFGDCPVVKKDTFDNPYKGQSFFNKSFKEANYQVHVLVGGYAPSYQDEDRKGMMLLTNILGGPALNSRLNLSIREKYGYSYNIESSYTPYSEVGFWTIYIGTDTKYLKKTMKLLHKELEILQKQPLGVQQLKQAKEQYKGHLALGMDSNSGMMLGLGKSVLFFNQIDTMEEIYASIEKLNSVDLQRIAIQYFDLEKISKLIFEIDEEEEQVD
jgi:predicted Zn-dependent peptidase